MSLTLFILLYIFLHIHILIIFEYFSYNIKNKQNTSRQLLINISTILLIFMKNHKTIYVHKHIMKNKINKLFNIQ